MILVVKKIFAGHVGHESSSSYFCVENDRKHFAKQGKPSTRAHEQQPTKNGIHTLTIHLQQLKKNNPIEKIPSLLFHFVRLAIHPHQQHDQDHRDSAQRRNGGLESHCESSRSPGAGSKGTLIACRRNGIRRSQTNRVSVLCAVMDRCNACACACQHHAHSRYTNANVGSHVAGLRRHRL